VPTAALRQGLDDFYSGTEMKAILLDAPGPPSSLRVGELEDPVPSAERSASSGGRQHRFNPVRFQSGGPSGAIYGLIRMCSGVDAAGIIEQARREGEQLATW